jgi:hypothetical protein
MKVSNAPKRSTDWARSSSCRTAADVLTAAHQRGNVGAGICAEQQTCEA